MSVLKKVLCMAKQIIAVGGGKGGVGKSIIAANLAVAFAQRRIKTHLVDADLGGANLHTLFGIDRPKVLLEHFIAGKVRDLNEASIPAPLDNLSLVCGGMPVLGTANPKFSQKSKLIRHIRRLESDIVVLDIGAGIGFNALDLFNAAEYKITAFVPQLTSLHNGYGFLKAAIHRLLERHISEEAKSFLQSSNPEAGEESLRQILTKIESADKTEADKARMMLNGQRLFLIANMIRSERERNVATALQQMIRDHLLVDSEVLGVLKFAEKIERSVNDRRPFMLSSGFETNAEVFRAMAQRLTAAHRTGLESRPSAPAVLSKDRTDPSRYDRKEPRYLADRLRAVLTGADNVNHTGHLINISHSGVLTAFDSRLPAPARGTLLIGPSRSGITVEVRVKEQHRAQKDQRIGFVFLDPDRKTQSLIASLVAESATGTAVSRGFETKQSS
jgi:flagellar biosynthesis protein FlhG